MLGERVGKRGPDKTTGECAASQTSSCGCYEEHNRKTGLKINFIRRLSCCVVLFATGTQYATGRMESKYLLGGQSGVECQRYKNRDTIAGALSRRSARGACAGCNSFVRFNSLGSALCSGCCTAAPL